MTLKSALKAISETRYRISAYDPQMDNYESIDIDYIHQEREEFSWALNIRTQWETRKNTVTNIGINRAIDSLEINIRFS